MLSRTLNLALAAAGAASAFLIPPSVSSADLDLGDDLALDMVASSLPRSIYVDCPTCESATKDGDDIVWTQRGGNTFLLDFDVGPHGDALAVQGVQLYPRTLDYSIGDPFNVTQVNPDGEKLPLRVNAFHFHYSFAETVSETGIELVPVTFQILSIEGHAVNPPALVINLLQDPEGKLIIASFQTAKPDEKNADEEKECNEWPLYCKWKAIVADRINGIKSHVGRPNCHKNKNHGSHKSNPMAGELYEGKPPHRFRPGHPHHMPGSNAHAHHRGHRMHMMFRRAFLTIFVPILIGIFAGTLTYLIGMALGCLIAVVIAKFRGRSVYESVAQEEDAEDVEDRGEKEVYARLPEHDAPPVYTEAVESEAAENKV